MNLIKTLNRFKQMSEELTNDLSQLVTLKKASKGELIVTQGGICDQLFFIDKGFLRGFHYEKGKEITTWFGIENDFATSTYSFLSRKQGMEYIEAIEESILYIIRYNDLNALYERHPEFNYIGRLLIEKYYVDLMERTLCLQFQTAKESYDQLVAQHPDIHQRAPLGHIASYLGISQETLSRIRRNI